MATGDDTIARRVADACYRRGRRVTIRRIAKSSGASPHPPVLFNAVSDGAYSAGVTTISIRASQAVGRLLAGDKLTIGSATATVGAEISARSPSFDPSVVVVPGFTNIQLSVALSASVSDGDAVTLTAATDATAWMMPTAIPARLRSDQIITGDLFLRMPAYRQTKPLTTDQLIIDGTAYSIIGIDPIFQRAITVAWDLQARTI